MSLLAYRLLVTVCVLAVVGWMVWDQRRLKQMTPFKWVIAVALLSVLVGNTWIGN